MNAEVKTYSSEKNQRIAETYAATKERRSAQTVIDVDLKVKFDSKTKKNMPEKQVDFFYNVFIEGKRFKNYILSLAQSNNDYSYDDDEDVIITEEHAKFLETLHSISEEVEKETAVDDASEDASMSSSKEEPLDIFKADQKNYKSVWYYTKGVNNPGTEYKEHELVFLKSFAKADILKRMCSDIKGLHTKKLNKEKVGRLKFVSNYNAITYKKQGFGFDINIANASVHLQGCPGWFKVWGIEQLAECRRIDHEYEIATAELIRVSDGNYHIHLTVYVNRQKLINYRRSKLLKKKYVKPGEEIVGIDFGCETNFTLSTGEKYNYLIEETERHKNLQRKVQRSEYGSNNYWKARFELQKSYAKMESLKDHLAREFVHYLKLHHDIIVMQDENLAGWLKGNHGKKVWHSIMGRVKELLMNEIHIQVVVLDRFIPTTKFCPVCGQMHKSLELWDREYACPNCKSLSDRDVHAA